MLTFICSILFLVLATAQPTWNGLVIDTCASKCPPGPLGFFLAAIGQCGVSGAGSYCPMFFWQRQGSRANVLAFTSGIGIVRDEHIVSFREPANPNERLFVTTLCNDALWIDQMQLIINRETKEYGVPNWAGWCMSTSSNGWSRWGSVRVPARRCYRTLELEAFNDIARTNQKGDVYGSHSTGPIGRRALESESPEDPFEATLALYLECNQMLGDNDVCTSLSEAAMALFDQENFELLSQDVSEQVISEEFVESLIKDSTSDTPNSNDRRRLKLFNLA